MTWNHTKKELNSNCGYSMCLVSIITIVKNDLAGLVRTVDSVNNQTCDNYQYIIIDGLSSDGSSEYAKSLSDNKVQVICGKDNGIYDAMNKGLSAARGRFVVFLNAGDTFVDNNTLRDLEPYLDKSYCDLVYGDSLEEISGNVIRKKTALGHKNIKYGMFCCHQSVYYRRETIGAMQYNTNYKISGDYEFTARFLSKAKKINRVPFALCVFNLSGASNKHKQIGVAENLEIQKKVLKISLTRRYFNKVIYKIASFLCENLPFIYRMIRDSI